MNNSKWFQFCYLVVFVAGLFFRADTINSNLCAVNIVKCSAKVSTERENGGKSLKDTDEVENYEGKGDTKGDLNKAVDSKYSPIDPGMACMFAGSAVVSLVGNLVIRRGVNSKLGSNEVDGKGSEQESKRDGTDESEKKNDLEKMRQLCTPMWAGVLLEVVPLTIFIVLLIYICCANQNENQNKTTINTKNL